MPRVFISYSRADEVFGRKLATSLSEAGAEVWIDINDIPKGMNWSTAVQQGLDQCEIMLVLVSPDSMSSDNVRDEWQYYLDNKKRVIPIFWRPTKMHFQLNRLQHIDFSKTDFASAFTVLLTALELQSSENQQLHKRAYGILLREYDDWVSFGKNDDQLMKYEILKIIFTHLHSATLNAEEMVYVLLSITNLKQPQQLDELFLKFRNWSAEINRQELVGVTKKALESRNSDIRLGIVRLVKELGIIEASELLLHHTEIEDINAILRLSLATLHLFGVTLPVALVSKLLRSNNDWLISTYALHSYKGKQVVLVITDGTEFSDDFKNLLEEAGFDVVELYMDLFSNLNLEVENLQLTPNLIKIYDLIVMIRGEHFGSISNENFYALIRDYVLNGGRLFATPWVGWETKEDGVLVDILPFQYQRFVEDVHLLCHMTEELLAKDLFENNIYYLTSFEYSKVKTNTVLLLEAQGGIPVFGYMEAGLGWSYYLNSCQHSCTEPQPSPFDTCIEFRRSMSNVINWIYKTCSQ